MELTLLRFGVEAMFSQAAENFFDMSGMLGVVLGVDEDIVEIDDYEEIDHVREDVVHKRLESGRRVRHPERHDEIFEGTVTGAEGGFPFVSLGDADVVVTPPEIDLGEYFVCP